MQIEIVTPRGEVKTIAIAYFPALDGWDIQARFLEFAASTDKVFRKAYTMEVLSYTRVIVRDQELQLSTDALVDNHLCSWQNVQRVFEETLRFNGIDPETHADKPYFWSRAGEEMAIAFLAEVTKMLGPALQMAGNVAFTPPAEPSESSPDTRQ